MNTLIIAEKPSVALRIAIALGDSAQRRLNLNGVSYYEIGEGANTTYIAAAVGHLFTIRQADATRGYPVLKVEWSPSYNVSKASEFTKKYLDVFKFLAPKAGRVINACDFDIEGTVIGMNIIRFLTGHMESAKRMKFSTTTIPDLKNSYNNLMPLDTNNFHAGEARHMLDWLWGINLSRALTSAMAGTRFNKALSIGRVQGPTLALLAKRELDISKFVPKPYWRIVAVINGVEFSNARGDIHDKKIVDTAVHATNANPNGTIVQVDVKEQMIRPYPPFDLTSLQVEASKAFHFDPSVTLALAQSLYERSFISYPRTSSQKLPPTLGLSRIIGDLAKSPQYEHLANRLIDESRFRPNEGMKSDEAHPAVYPTGVPPKNLTDPEAKLYDLIVRRFLSVFAPYAKTASTQVIAQFGEERYVASGTTMLEKGWLEFYHYAHVSEKLLPRFDKGSRVKASKVYTQDLQTQPPKRFTKAGLVAELERRMLGTKATRASIIDTLFKREYIEGTSIRVTDFGMRVYEALADNVSMIVDENTTRKLEEDMERISKGEKTSTEVVKEGEQILLQAIKAFDSNKAKIAEEMKKGMEQGEAVLGRCPNDGGDLVIKRSRIGKQFAACANYPKCTVTYSLPQNAKIVSTGRACEHCHTPIVKVIRAGKGVFEMDLDPKCITKESWGAKKKIETKMAPEKIIVSPTETKAKAKKPAVRKKKSTVKKKPDAML